jgi:hypothetical protein
MIIKCGIVLLCIILMLFLLMYLISLGVEGEMRSCSAICV